MSKRPTSPSSPLQGGLSKDHGQTNGRILSLGPTKCLLAKSSCADLPFHVAQAKSLLLHKMLQKKASPSNPKARFATSRAGPASARERERETTGFGEIDALGRVTTQSASGVTCCEHHGLSFVAFAGCYPRYSQSMSIPVNTARPQHCADWLKLAILNHC